MCLSKQFAANARVILFLSKFELGSGEFFTAALLATPTMVFTRSKRLYQVDDPFYDDGYACLLFFSKGHAFIEFKWDCLDTPLSIVCSNTFREIWAKHAALDLSESNDIEDESNHLFYCNTSGCSSTFKSVCSVYNKQRLPY